MTLSDVECRGVRQRAFQAVADLDKHLAVLDEHKENHTVAPLLLPHAPRLCHALCVISDIRVALHFGKNRDHHLVGSFSLELSKLLVEARCGFFRNNAGVIIEVRARRWWNYFRGVRTDREQRDASPEKGGSRSGANAARGTFRRLRRNELVLASPSRAQAACHPRIHTALLARPRVSLRGGRGAGAGELKLNCTGGGFSAPGCAAKNGFGGKPSMPAIKFVGKLRTATL